MAAGQKRDGGAVLDRLGLDRGDNAHDAGDVLVGLNRFVGATADLGLQFGVRSCVVVVQLQPRPAGKTALAAVSMRGTLLALLSSGKGSLSQARS